MKNKKRITVIIYILASLSIPLFISAAIQIIQFGNIITTLGWVKAHCVPFLISYILLFLLFSALFSLSWRLWLSTLILGAVSIFSAALNLYKCQAKSEPFLPWDLSSFKEFKLILSQIEPQPCFFAILSLIALIFIAIILNRLEPLRLNSLKTTIILRISVFVIIFIMCIGYVNLTYYNKELTTKFNMNINNWDQKETCYNSGFVGSFMLNTIYLNIKRPQAYTKKNMNHICEEIITSSDNKAVSQKSELPDKPNIIVIMSEGFWDVNTLPGVSFEEELLPTINMLRENFISGTTFSPKFGGGTSNVEFEAVTGFSNQFLLPESVPYEQYLIKPSFSIARYLKNKGYATLGIHANLRDNWNRDNAYKNMDFDNFIAQDNFEKPEIQREYISDIEVSKKIIEEYELHKDNSDNPWFNFTVTMQNHKGYYSNKWKEDEIVKFKSQYTSHDVTDGLKDLATGLSLSDKALKNLIDYFKIIDEPTIIVFFGDHMNSLGYTKEQLFEETGYLKKGYSKLDEEYNLYTTPLVIWNNYTDMKINLGEISTFQIMPTVMSLFNLDMPSYFDFLINGKEISRGYARDVILDSKGRPSYKLNNEQQDFYDTFKLIQYDQMFGRRYTDSLFK